MNHKRQIWITMLTLSLWIAAGLMPTSGCTPAKAKPPTPLPEPTHTPPATETPAPAAGLANPASVYCTEQGHKLEIRSDKDGNQTGVCLFADGTECEEWAYFHGECSPGVHIATVAPTATPVPDTATPVPPSDPAAACTPITVESGPEFKLWRKYTHENYGFSLLLPPGWVLIELVEPRHTLRDHAMILWSAEEPRARFQVAFRRQDEEQFIGRTGVGSGEIVEAGAVCFCGQEMKRRALVFEGKEMTVLYGPGRWVERGDMVFTLYLDYRGGWEDKTALSKKIQAVTDQIIATFQL